MHQGRRPDLPFVPCSRSYDDCGLWENLTHWWLRLRLTPSHYQCGHLVIQGNALTCDYLSWYRSCLTHWLLGVCHGCVKLLIFKLISRIDICSISCEITLTSMPQDLTDDSQYLFRWWLVTWSTLVLMMACCCQGTSHYINNCFNGLLPYCVIRPWCVNGRNIKGNEMALKGIRASAAIILTYFVKRGLKSTHQRLT